MADGPAQRIGQRVADLCSRGLHTGPATLFVLDGAKALHAAVRRTWGGTAKMQLDGTVRWLKLLLLLLLPIFFGVFAKSQTKSKSRIKSRIRNREAVSVPSPFVAPPWARTPLRCQASIGTRFAVFIDLRLKV
jgi:hypothetical protein